jgi:signal transduction histidine kinase/DNA-binding response OmpR family regulator
MDPSALPAKVVQRFNLSVQRNRAAVFTLLGAAAMVARAAGEVEFDLLPAFAAYAFALLTIGVFVALYRLDVERRWGVRLHPWWLGCDVLLSTYIVSITHGSSGLWLLWYLANVSAAAFVAGRRAAVWTGVACVAAYLGLLVAVGEIRGLDHGLALALGRLALLFGGTFFFVRGIADLRDKRLQIALLMAEKTARIDDLSRLTEELDRRNRAVAEANARIQEANRAKSQFLANMSHELRTPLNSIIGFSEILADRLHERIEPRYAKFIANILASGRHLLSLINDILDLSKIEAGKMELTFEPVSVVDVVHGVESVMHGVAARRSIELVVELPPDLPPIVADAPRLKQVLYNLVANAVKFSPDAATVTIACRALAAEASPLAEPSLAVAVVDRGIGIAPESQAAIFEEFRQLDGGADRALGGTGLGLALVKRFVEMHRGRIDVDSAPGRGSTFTVTLPCDARPRAGVEAQGAAPATAPAATGGPVVLVVEDDDEFFRALAGDLAGAGYSVVRAARGEAVCSLARRVAPAVITLDLVLPGRDGWEVLKELKASPDLAATPVLIVSLVANHELGFALGAADYFVKPLDRERFLRRLRTLEPAVGRGAVRVLVIDDDPQVHEMLAPELEAAGYRLLVAYDGPHGLALASGEHPAVIVLDLMLPGMSGFEVANELQRRPETAAIPIVVLTAKDLSREERDRLAGCMRALLSKAPTDRRRLLETVRRLAPPAAVVEG